MAEDRASSASAYEHANEVLPSFLFVCIGRVPLFLPLYDEISGEDPPSSEETNSADSGPQSLEVQTINPVGSCETNFELKMHGSTHQGSRLAQED